MRRLSNMSIKTWTIRTAILSTALTAGAAATAMSINDNPLHVFASCAGRMEAEVTFASAWNQAAPQDAERARGHFEDLVEAVTPPEEADTAEMSRVQAKVNHIALLWNATFSLETAQAQRAAQAAAREVGLCSRLLTG